MNYHILDTETASLQGGVCEIAWLKVDDHLNIVQEFRSLVNPERPIDAGAQAVHGISDADVAGMPTLAEIAAEQITSPIQMVAHNAPFDRRMIANHIAVDHAFCTLQLVRGVITGTTNHKLEVLQAELFLPEQKSHSALGDVHTVRDLLLYVINFTGDSFDTLYKRSLMPKMLHKVPFGKYKGKSFNSLPPSYRQWLLQQDNVDKDVRYTLEKLKGI